MLRQDILIAREFFPFGPALGGLEQSPLLGCHTPAQTYLRFLVVYSTIPRLSLFNSFILHAQTKTNFEESLPLASGYLLVKMSGACFGEMHISAGHTWNDYLISRNGSACKYSQKLS